MKILACGLLSAMLLAGTAAALESISQPIATSGYTYYAIRADGALLAWGDSFHGAVGPTDQDPLPWEEANVLLENARYVDAGFITAAAIDEDGDPLGLGRPRGPDRRRGGAVPAAGGRGVRISRGDGMFCPVR